MESIQKDNILVWLPSPMGDAILCTPALRAIRARFDSSKITFLGSGVVRQVLSPTSFADSWLELKGGVLTTAKMLRAGHFTQTILFKNSFGSALACFLAGIPVRTGYAREGRGILLNDRLYPPRLPSGDLKPISMLDYYLAVASWLGADVQDRRIELSIEPSDMETVRTRLPRVFNSAGPVIILVPGASAGPSKRWPAERFAEVADRLVDDYNATVVLSVAPNTDEKRIAEQIVMAASYKLVNLADTAISLGELKALYSKADLVICNDTGPRHIAIGLKRNVITLVGPNNPEWTDPGYDDEIFVRGEAPCAPCDKPVCKKPVCFCMEAVTVERVIEAASAVLEKKIRPKPGGSNSENNSIKFFVDPAYKAEFEKLGLTSIDAVFSFGAGKNLAKSNLAPHRSRIEFQIGSPATTLFLKRYDRPPMMVQLKNWLSAKKRISCGSMEFDTAASLAGMGINTPKVVAWGRQGGIVFERRSFVIMEKVPGESLERSLPGYFKTPATAENIQACRRFIGRLAAFIRRFHDTGFCHRDLYLCHIFATPADEFYLIDLARAFRPTVLNARYRVKDLAQLNYSAQARYFSLTGRMRFYLAYAGRSKLTPEDKTFIRKIIRKTGRIERHDSKRAGSRASQ